MPLKKSRRYCKITSYGKSSINIDEKFSWEDDPDKRVKIPEFLIRYSDLRYLDAISAREGVSRSCYVEYMIRMSVIFGLLDDYKIPSTKNGSRSKILSGSKRNMTRCVPKFTIHPSYIEILNRLKKRHKVSLAVIMMMLFDVYRDRYPIYNLFREIT